MRGTRYAELSAFVAVAEHTSFTRAAIHLGVSTATLSQTVRALEERLGVRLLNRTTRSVAPTEAGERVLVRLRVPPTAASLVIAPLLARFLAEYPEIGLEISVDAALTDIVAGRFDAGI